MSFFIPHFERSGAERNHGFCAWQAPEYGWEGWWGGRKSELHIRSENKLRHGLKGKIGDWSNAIYYRWRLNIFPEPLLNHSHIFKYLIYNFKRRNIPEPDSSAPLFLTVMYSWDCNVINLRITIVSCAVFNEWSNIRCIPSRKALLRTRSYIKVLWQK